MLRNRVAEIPSLAARQADHARARVQWLTHAAGEQTSVWNRALQEQVARHPATSLVMALGVGVFLGWLIKRR